MNLPEFANIFSLLAVQLRQIDADGTLMRGYYAGLQDLEPELLKAAAERLSRTAKWFPRTSEWRAVAQAIRRAPYCFAANTPRWRVSGRRSVLFPAGQISH